MENKKDTERKYVLEVKEIVPDFPSGNIIDSESPDFLIKSKERTIGIEVTCFNRKQSTRNTNDREIEAIHSKIMNSAQRIFETKHKVPLQVSPTWKINNRLSRKQINILATSLVEIIEKNIPKDIHVLKTIENIEFRETPLSTYCSYINVIKLRKKPLWASHEGGWIFVNKSEIDERIKNKKNKISCYLQKCNEIWLIIICEGNSISSSVDLQDVDSWTFFSPFDKIFLYDREETTVHCLSNNKIEPNL